ncbi:MAG: radical SAM protein [Saprospiraceae bacterium]|nr:radical SAM protein [Saprospiraceae bacterium]
MKLKKSPYLLYADAKGLTYEDKSLYALGRSGWDAGDVPLEEWIELPDGGQLYTLPDRQGLGIDVKSGQIRVCEKGRAVAAFVPPAYTVLRLSPYVTLPEATPLPLYCYSAVSWSGGKLYVPATRIEQDIRQEAAGYDDEKIARGIALFTSLYPQNRLVKHLAENCAARYTCPAARNFFLGRWECPIPVSPACNANCLGCISFIPATEVFQSSHDRLSFKPTAAEIIEYTVPHLETAPYPIISFGQGCEGEPLLMWETIREAILQIRKFTPKGSININTNGSKPEAVNLLCQSGLNSIRVSMNSAQERLYTAYYLPNNYKFQDIVESLKIVRSHGGWASINYFVFPGVTDTAAEFQALCDLIDYTGLSMIQWRNFNIDPDFYLHKLNIGDSDPGMGLLEMMNLLQEKYPDLKFGYFNPPKERMANYEMDFAH